MVHADGKDGKARQAGGEAARNDAGSICGWTTTHPGQTEVAPSGRQWQPSCTPYPHVHKTRKCMKTNNTTGFPHKPPSNLWITSNPEKWRGFGGFGERSSKSTEGSLHTSMSWIRDLPEMVLRRSLTGLEPHVAARLRDLPRSPAPAPEFRCPSCFPGPSPPSWLPWKVSLTLSFERSSWRGVAWAWSARSLSGSLGVRSARKR